MVNEIINAVYDRELHRGYDYVYTVDDAPKNDAEFCLHAHHDRYEIYLFLAGNNEFHVEGNIYRTHPHDLFIARPAEMHHNVFLSSERYERVIIHVMFDFFTKNNCAELEEIFRNKEPGADCHIPARIVDRELYHLIMKMNRYLKEEAYSIADNILIEILYLLNHIEEPLTVPVAEDQRIQNVLLYINSHLSEPLCLDDLSSRFYINKYHLCRMFKSITGHTINQYIIRKRLALTQEYHQKGQSLLEASINAGFNSYAHFYRMYRKFFGSSPREGMGQGGQE